MQTFILTATANASGYDLNELYSFLKTNCTLVLRFRCCKVYRLWIYSPYFRSNETLFLYLQERYIKIILQDYLSLVNDNFRIGIAIIKRSAVSKEPFNG